MKEIGTPCRETISLMYNLVRVSILSSTLSMRNECADFGKKIDSDQMAIITFDNPPLVLMADNQTMAELLQAPTEWYEDAIVILEINANFELKHGSTRIWLEKEPPRSILTWDDLVSKFINQFFLPSKMTNLRNEITRFQQRFDESFYEAWDRFNDLLRACPHHGFSELHQLDTFYNALNANDQDSLNSAAVENFLDKMPS
ncbi:reverse transcriptase domain-containing protein [Tanacetum coccineum]